MALLMHDVYFRLKDPSTSAAEGLMDSALRHLAPHAGVVFFATGRRERSHQREVNDLDFDVSLSVCFESKEAHDAYQATQEHLAFIEENQGNWQAVRVFDSTAQRP